MYRVNEGAINLPNGWHDRTINVVSSSLTGAGTTLTITRDELPWGMNFYEFVDDQGKQIAEALKNFELVHRQNIKVDRLPAVEMECRWTSAQGKVHQLITTVLYGQKILVFTASAPDKMSDSQKAELRHIVLTFRFDPKRG